MKYLLMIWKERWRVSPSLCLQRVEETHNLQPLQPVGKEESDRVGIPGQALAWFTSSQLLDQRLAQSRCSANADHSNEWLWRMAPTQLGPEAVSTRPGLKYKKRNPHPTPRSNTTFFFNSTHSLVPRSESAWLKVWGAEG